MNVYKKALGIVVALGTGIINYQANAKSLDTLAAEAFKAEIQKSEPGQINGCIAYTLDGEIF
tara:strand:- start:288 stop:473 length:186 start_codon:yes stop_codon:yes gene_type:complete